MKIIGKMKGEIKCKRFYLDGVIIKDVCPTCGFENEFSNKYLSYPRAGEINMIHLGCEECDTLWSKGIKLDVVLAHNERI